MTDQSVTGTQQYRVVCTDCDLDEPYSEKDIAIGRGLAHNDVTGHVAHVEGGESA
ncbi:hypothetical protein [Halostella litorea]|uniref:hypothetical protein n=1 Tax=Halostella litorea TaxID=2528831 RepID=UPI00138746F9|nr:hypothetical protein [Halostella litorea]